MQRILQIIFVTPAALLLLVISAGVGLAEVKLNSIDQQFRTPESGTYSFEFKNEPLDRALFVISGRTGAEFIYEPWITDGIMVTSVFRDKELRAILHALLGEFGLEARRIRTGVFVIRYSMRRYLPVHQLPSEGAGVLARRHVTPRPVASAAKDHSLPVRDIIRQLALP